MKKHIIAILLCWSALYCQCQLCLESDALGCKSWIDTLAISLNEVAESCNGEVGIVFISDSGDTITVNNENKYPLMSVFKLHQALATLRTMQHRGISTDSIVSIDRHSLNSETWSPMLKDIHDDTLKLSLGNLLQYSLTQSDNNASNYLFDSVIGIQDVDTIISGFIPRNSFSLKYTEAEMYTNHDLAYMNTSSPLGAAILINKVFSTPAILTPPYMDNLRSGLVNCTTGSDRIPKPLMKHDGITIGHKTGSGFRIKDLLVAQNDVAYIRLPNNRYYTLVVFIKDFYGDDSEASSTIAHISGLVYDAVIKNY